MFYSNSVNRCFRPHAREGNALFGHVCNITLRELQIIMLFKDVFNRLADITVFISKKLILIVNLK